MPENQIGTALESLPVEALIAGVARGIAEGQMALDQVSMEIAEYMGEAQIAVGQDPDGNPEPLSLIELGFTPHFYQFTETSIELKIAISSQLRTENNTTSKNQSQGRFKGLGRTIIKAASVDAAYTAKYGFDAEASSIVNTVIRPVPPPEMLETILREQIEQRRLETREAEQRAAAIATVAGLRARIEALQRPDPEPENLAALLQELERWREDYESLTEANWTMIDSDPLRTDSHRQLREMIDSVEQLIVNPPTEADTDTALDTTFDLITTLDATLAQIGQRLTG